MLTRALPDITSDSQAETPATLQWVGMEDIAVPLTLNVGGDRSTVVAAKANAYVSLEQSEAKGIHMSRLHGLVNTLASRPLSQASLQTALAAMVQSQNGIGQQARVTLSFDLLLEKPALLSEESGFQTYPVTLNAELLSTGYAFEFEVTIPYSSTCPCSAALARQLYADAIEANFTGETVDKAALLAWVQSAAGSIATPHSQRSYAYIRFSTANGEWPDLAALIFQLEHTIGTPVQTAVKRVDEQHFAKLNAENLMFCEDAARKIKSALERLAFVDDYWFKVEHQESLHAHNAVVIDQKHR